MRTSPHILDLKVETSRALASELARDFVLEVAESNAKVKTEIKKHKSVLRSTFHWLLYFISVGALIWGFPRFLSWKLGTNYPIAAVTSGSMWPELKRGDLVLIQGASKESIGVGDIVVWQQGGSSANSGQAGFIIHRVVKLSEEGVITKGDGNFKEDLLVDWDKVVGKAITRGGKAFRAPYLGFMSIIGADIRNKIGS